MKRVNIFWSFLLFDVFCFSNAIGETIEAKSADFVHGCLWYKEETTIDEIREILGSKSDYKCAKYECNSNGTLEKVEKCPVIVCPPGYWKEKVKADFAKPYPHCCPRFRCKTIKNCDWYDKSMTGLELFEKNLECGQYFCHSNGELELNRSCAYIRPVKCPYGQAVVQEKADMPFPDCCQRIKCLVKDRCSWYHPKIPIRKLRDFQKEYAPEEKPYECAKYECPFDGVLKKAEECPTFTCASGAYVVVISEPDITRRFPKCCPRFKCKKIKKCKWARDKIRTCKFDFGMRSEQKLEKRQTKD